MRKYSSGAVLLDKNDPSKVIGRTRGPILAAADEDREGYVPNVVYSCGALLQGDNIFIPYGVADSSIAFAFVAVSALLATMCPPRACGGRGTTRARNGAITRRRARWVRSHRPPAPGARRSPSPRDRTKGGRG